MMIENCTFIMKIKKGDSKTDECISEIIFFPNKEIQTVKYEIMSCENGKVWFYTRITLRK